MLRTFSGSNLKKKLRSFGLGPHYKEIVRKKKKKEKRVQSARRQEAVYAKRDCISSASDKFCSYDHLKCSLRFCTSVVKILSETTLNRIKLTWLRSAHVISTSGPLIEKAKLCSRNARVLISLITWFLYTIEGAWCKTEESP